MNHDSDTKPVATAPASSQQEPEYERLIRVIQNREGSVPKKEREAALLELIKMFRYLIKKIATECWRRETGERRDEFEHDTLTTFLELVVEDYTPVRYGGATTFAPYIQSKLYWRTVYRAQRLCLQNSRAFAVDFTNTAVDSEAHGDQTANYIANRIPFKAELREALLANAGNVEDGVIDRLRDDQICAQLKELREIATTILDAREHYVWDAYFFQPMMVKEIGERLEPKIGTSRVNQLVQQVRQKVLAEYARRHLGTVLR